jgi:hypothetical protein
MNFKHIDLVDGIWVRHATESSKHYGGSGVFKFAALRAALQTLREQRQWPAAEKRIAVLAVDPDNEMQAKYAFAMEKEGFEVMRVDYRHSYVSRTISETDALGPAQQSLSTWIAYMLGLIGARPYSTSVVFSGSFDIAGPLEDYTSVGRAGRAILTYFRPFLDRRWFEMGLVANRLGDLGFVDLAEQSPKLLGVDLLAHPAKTPYESSKRVPL